MLGPPDLLQLHAVRLQIDHVPPAGAVLDPPLAADPAVEQSAAEVDETQFVRGGWIDEQAGVDLPNRLAEHIRLRHGEGAVDAVEHLAFGFSFAVPGAGDVLPIHAGPPR